MSDGLVAEPTSRPRLSAAEAAARLTWIVLNGPTLDPDTIDLLRRGAGGVVLFARNVETPEQVRQLTQALRANAAVPLRIAVDQEGGHIVRLGAPLTRFPSAMAIGATRSPALAYQVAHATGVELASVGIDVALAPVLDIAADPRNPVVGSRSYGARPGLVAALGAAAIRGYLDAGVIPTPKHFPGHGRTPLDSHVDRPMVRGGLPALAALDLPPFQAAVAAATPVVMIGHVAYEGLTFGRPATLAPAVLERLLRLRLGFRGVTLTDAMVMGAVADGRSIPDACVDALRAGIDLVMPLEPQRRAMVEIERAICRGALGEASVACSVARVEALDARAARIARPRPPLESATRAAAHRDLAELVARRSVTLVYGEWRRALMPEDSVLIVEFAPATVSPIEDGSPHAGSFSARLEARLPRSVSVVIDHGPGHNQAEAEAIRLARSVDRIVVATRDSGLDRNAQMLVSAIAAGHRPIVHVALRSPGDLAVMPSDVAIASYSDVPASLDAVVDALTRPGDPRTVFPGTLPMPLDPLATQSADLTI